MISRAACIVVALYVGLSPATGQEEGWRHGLALMGTPKYEIGFGHFDYVNPDAPKGGLVRFGVQGTFDNFNLVVSGVKGELEAGISRLYDTLMTRSMDEVGTVYGLLAEAVRYPADYSSVTYRLNRHARWHDGRAVTPEDVIFSLDSLKTYSPLYALYYKNVSEAEKTGEREVTFTFNETGNRELPQIVGQLPVLPKHWWEATGPDGKSRNIGETTLEPPLGSGPYRLKSFEAGRTASYERVPDYWGESLNVNRGQHNLDEVRYEYFRDATVLLEAFKADRIDYRSENIARQWATAYDFPAVHDGRVVKEEFPLRAMGVMQALVFNLRQDRFKDERVRRAFNLAFDFEDINRTLFYGLYDRIDSFFFGTDLAATGLPEGRELAILESLGDKVPASVFTEPYRNPINGTNQAVRDNLREAMRLLEEAGYELKGGRMVSRLTGEPLTAEYITADQSFERVILPYRQALERIGIGLSVRALDPAQYQNRVRSFDFDITTHVWTQSLSPGNEQREYWGSGAADQPGSQNIAGIKDPAIDALIERIIFAGDREELVAATRALDRVLLHHNYVVPQWYSLVARTARWNRFGRPVDLPRYGGSAFPDVWWYDPALAARVGTAR
ncbi:extracellular solute-binding protein [Microvirga arabica]|uniref:extracellular solute-binding protein n=1 Tax=Microvirga arabica TaxID=1128671 RepID=UPI001939D5E7|nr:extracellular solute-binding protein [Microvirga arabica]MBM1170034.1 ABC transporter substrate-binding protein [Microvirga arabica]